MAYQVVQGRSVTKKKARKTLETDVSFKMAVVKSDLVAGSDFKAKGEIFNGLDFDNPNLKQVRP